MPARPAPASWGSCPRGAESARPLHQLGRRLAPSAPSVAAGGRLVGLPRGGAVVPSTDSSAWRPDIPSISWQAHANDGLYSGAPLGSLGSSPVRLKSTPPTLPRHPWPECPLQGRIPSRSLAPRPPQHQGPTRAGSQARCHGGEEGAWRGNQIGRRARGGAPYGLTSRPCPGWRREFGV